MIPTARNLLSSTPQSGSRHGLLVEQSLDLVQRAIQRVTYRRKIPRRDQEDFYSYAIEKLVEKEEKVFAELEAVKHPAAYLYQVVVRLWADYNVERWGRWRPLAKSVRLGTAAERLDRLVRREGLSADEALRRLGPLSDAEPSFAELSRYAAALVSKRRPTEVPLEPEVDVPAAPSPVATEHARHELCQRILPQVRKIFAALEPSERDLLRWKFRQYLTGREIGERTGETTGQVFRRYYALMRRLADEFEAAGVDRDAIRSVTSSDGAVLIERGAFDESLRGTA